MNARHIRMVERFSLRNNALQRINKCLLLGKGKIKKTNTNIDAFVSVARNKVFKNGRGRNGFDNFVPSGQNIADQRSASSDFEKLIAAAAANRIQPKIIVSGKTASFHPLAPSAPENQKYWCRK